MTFISLWRVGYGNRESEPTLNSRWKDFDHVDIGLSSVELSPETHGKCIQGSLGCAITRQGGCGYDGKVGLGAVP